MSGVIAAVPTALTVARTDLHAALVAGLDGILPASRIHPAPPPQPSAPMVWLSAFGMAPDTVGDGAVGVVVVTGDVLAVTDGAAAEQIAACDVLGPAIWQAADAIVDVTAATVGYVNTGGPLLYGVTVSFRAVVAADALCPLELIQHPEVTPL